MLKSMTLIHIYQACFLTFNMIFVLSVNHTTQKISIARNRKPGGAYGLRLLIDKTLLYDGWSIGGLFWLVEGYISSVLH